MPPIATRREFFFKFYYEMVHSDVYLNKYVVSIAPFSTPACPDCIGVRAIFLEGGWIDFARKIWDSARKMNSRTKHN